MSINDSMDTSYRTANTVDHSESTETKPSAKTTEFLVFLSAVTAVIVTAFMVGQDANTGIDPFGAQDALRYITYLTIGYMVARGLAKSGTRYNNHN